jgi:hypothetical protein
MAFEWLKSFQHGVEKDPNYAQKVLAAYRMGMRAKGAIKGVTVLAAPNCCSSARSLPPGTVYHPDEAPIVPLKGCSQPDTCGCIYRPAMDYEPESSSHEH